MSVRGFTTTARKLLELVGKVSLQDVTKVNETSGANWAENVQIVASAIENQMWSLTKSSEFHFLPSFAPY
ncbi:hypothetical protein CTAM01_02687 [Colletotrichum tamarilloi]|uniref:Uncharacterized protein n=1 Tax=Colletotrichum tamarilloi TaxID=1209934 RepID=A0ABQ9RM72_9PEZI|nr:uncharacterized protein CTAM01_02687 [Colletotrichum tamarilloi]KAK1507575.1 hypothetical protein CTAM01_02687 [Colletotrichum tamarilloi]